MRFVRKCEASETYQDNSRSLKQRKGVSVRYSTKNSIRYPEPVAETREIYYFSCPPLHH